MFKYNFLPVIFFTFFIISDLTGVGSGVTQSVNINVEDTLKENQILFNGRVWRNRYNMIKEDQFLFSKDFLPGSITIGGKTFIELAIRYDIYNDEILTLTNHGLILQLNKEMVDSFTISFQNTNWKFIKIPDDSVKIIKGYLNLLFRGKSALYVKYKKEIELLAVERKYDKFFQTQRIYFEKDNLVYAISGKRDFFRLLGEYKKQVNDFRKKNRLLVSREKPASFIPLIQFYDSLRQ